MPIPYSGPGAGGSYFGMVKERKRLVATGSAFPIYFNHPNRLASVSMTGSTTVDRDGRVSATGLTTDRTVIVTDYSLFTTWSRVFHEKSPKFLLPLNANYGANEFGMMTYFKDPWRVLPLAFTPDNEIVGTITEYEYSRAVDTDPWTEDSATDSDNTLGWGLSIGEGGTPGFGGKGPDDDANSVIVTAIPGDAFGSVVIYRLPWDQSWADESTLLDTAFAAFIAAGGADYSGTCTANVEFGY